MNPAAVEVRDGVLASVVRDEQSKMHGRDRLRRCRLGQQFFTRNADEQTVTVPVEYVMDKAKVDLAGKWRTIVRIPKRTIGWMTPEAGTQSVGVADAVAGELIPLNSAVALVTNVVGEVLP